MSMEWPKRKWTVKFLLPHCEEGEILTSATGISDAIEVAKADYEFMAGPNTGILITEVRTYPENEKLWWWEANCKTFGDQNMAWARIQDGKPVEVLFEDFTGKVHPDLVFIPIPDAVVEFIDSNYIVEGSGKKAKIAPPSVSYFVGQLQRQMSFIRWQNQQVGVVYNGNRYSSTRESVTDMVGRIQDGQEFESIKENGAGSFGVNWKSMTGMVSLSLVELKAIKTAISEHIQGCFDREAEINETLATEFGNSKDYAMMVKRYREEQLKGWPNIEDREPEVDNVIHELLPEAVDFPPEAVSEENTEEVVS